MAEDCVKRHWLAWNGHSNNYRIRAETPTDTFTDVLYTVGDVVSRFPGKVAITELYSGNFPSSPNLETGPNEGRTAYDTWNAVVTFSESAIWKDEAGNVQGALRNWDGTYPHLWYRIEYITMHESGHLAGLDEDRSSPTYNGNVMYWDYPPSPDPVSPVQLSANDIETLQYNYDVRKF